MTAGGLLLVREIATTLPVPGPGEAERLRVAAERASAALADFEHDLERGLESASDRFALGEEAFNFRLHYEHALRDTAPGPWRYALHLRGEGEADRAQPAARLG